MFFGKLALLKDPPKTGSLPKVLKEQTWQNDPRYPWGHLQIGFLMCGDSIVQYPPFKHDFQH